MMELRIAYLYPDQLNIYGDRGNMLTLFRRCSWRGITVQIDTLDLGATLDPERYDLYFMGGGQDTQQMAVCEDLKNFKGESLKQAASNQAVFLTICGGYQLLGHYYKPHQGPELRGLSLIDACTVAGHMRFIGNMVIRRSNQPGSPGYDQTVVGFENHSGLTYLGEGVQPLGYVMTGNGNNGQDGTEGVAAGNIYGSYLHGSLLPKNPALADELILKALQRRYDIHTLPAFEQAIDDRFEQAAHQRILALNA